MTTLIDRPNTALLIIDMQNDVVKDTYARDTVIENIEALIDKARIEEVPIVWIQHSNDGMPEGSEGWQYVSELQRFESEPLVPKRYGDAFEDTKLENVLAGLNVGRLVVTGAESDACIHSTIYGAFARGYDVTLVSDAHTAQDKTQWGAPSVPQVIAYMNLCWSFQAAPGRTAQVVKTSEVTFDKQAD
jgi:nicotinamidase-related amidase